MSERTTLREFQQDLSRRLAAAAASRSENHSVLAVESGGDAWLVALVDAGEVMPVPKLTAAPLIKPWYAGIANIRGALYSVVDFSAFLGCAPVRLGGAARLLLCGQKHGLNAGVLVDRVLGLRDARELEPVDREAASPAWHKSSRRDRDGRLYRELDAGALVHSTEFMNVGI